MIKTPWTLRVGDGENGAAGVGYIECPHTLGYLWPREVAVVYGMEDFSDAAALIVAAPDLLESLKGLLADIQDYQRINRLGGEDNHWQLRANAAIAKAEGR